MHYCYLCHFYLSVITLFTVKSNICILFSFSEFLIVKCNLQCREQAHFHCCYCPNTVIRKAQILKHLASCTKRQVPATEPATVEPAAISEPIVTCEPIDPSASVDLNDPVATSEPIVHSAPVAFKEPAVAEVPLPVKSVLIPRKLRIQKKVQCVQCGVTVNKKNLDVHVKRKHTGKICDVTEDRHLPSQCIDPVNSIYAVEK